MTRRHCGVSGKMDKVVQDLPACWLTCQWDRQSLCLLSFKNTNKTDLFQQSISGLPTHRLPADSCLIRFPNGSVIPDNYSYKYFYYGMPRYHSVKRHKDKEHNKGQRPSTMRQHIGYVWTTTSRLLSRWLLGLLGCRGKGDKQFWEAGEHTHKLEEGGKMDLFITQDIVYRRKGTWYCFLQHNKGHFQSTEFRHPA